MRRIFILLLLLSIFQYKSKSQGCVAIRSTGTVCTKPHTESMKGWMLNSTYRYFRSFRHFVGTEEQKERMEEHTEVINWQHTLNLNLVRTVNNRWSFAIDVPILANRRSSLYEHGGNSAGEKGRHETKSFGIGDIRLVAYRWLFDPAKSMKCNIQLGLGLKLPTGDYRYQDFFIKNDSTKILGPVDQSIQLGDGGTGISFETNVIGQITRNFSAYANFYYLVNPREQNGVSTARGGTVSQTAILYGSSTMSVPDQYMLRAGVNYSLDNFTASLGLREECIPSRDLIGGNGGFRRPGYVKSIEPGVHYSLKKISGFLTVPVAFKRDRTQSNADRLRTEATGIYAHGDAAFADYSINLGLSFKL
jgi:hypothetical protein